MRAIGIKYVSWANAIETVKITGSDHKQLPKSMKLNLHPGNTHTHAHSL